MYSRKDRDKALEAYARNNLSAAATTEELGYPSPPQLRHWYKEVFGDKRYLPTHIPARYTDEQKATAVFMYFDNDECLAATIRELGYPRDDRVLASWIDEIASGRRTLKETTKRAYSYNRKKQVI